MQSWIINFPEFIHRCSKLSNNVICLLIWFSIDRMGAIYLVYIYFYIYTTLKRMCYLKKPLLSMGSYLERDLSSLGRFFCSVKHWRRAVKIYEDLLFFFWSRLFILAVNFFSWERVVWVALQHNKRNWWGVVSEMHTTLGHCIHYFFDYLKYSFGFTTFLYFQTYP